MDARELKVGQIVATGRISRESGYILVPSRTGKGRYKVVLDGLYPNCSCDHFELAGREGYECIHMAAARAWLAELTTGTPAPRADPGERIKRPTYKRNWEAINLAATTERTWFVRLLSDLTRDIPDPPRKPTRGTRPVPLADRLFAAVYRAYAGFSARRFTGFIEEAAEQGHMTRPLHFNTVLDTLDNPATTPILNDLIAKSASPFRGTDTEWAVDSTGFASVVAERNRWVSEKWGTVHTDCQWVKAHVCCSTRSTCVALAVVLEKNSGDSTQFPGLVAAAHAAGFRLDRVTADKAYAGNANFEATDKAGGTLYASFKSNATGAVGGLFEKAFHYFSAHREEFLEKYHRRSLIESAFSAVKRVFGDTIRSRTQVAMGNEVLTRLVAHNIRCVVLAIYEHGLHPVFDLPGVTPEEGDDGPRDILRFPTRA